MIDDLERLAHKQLLLSDGFLEFTKRMFKYMNGKNYLIGDHHRLICQKLDDVVHGKIKKLIINVAPRYGKTLLVSQMFIAYGFALNPESKFLHLSYSSTLTSENSKAVQDIMRSGYYRGVFGNLIDKKAIGKSKWDTVCRGGLLATSMLGQITGFGAGILDDELEREIDNYTAFFNPNRFGGAIVIDDPIKPEEALSDNVRESVNRRFETTIRNRVNSRNTPIVIIMQRLHEHDLCGYLQEIEPDEWTVVSIPTLDVDENGNEKALWPLKHNVEELHKMAEINDFVFQTQYQQNPTPIEGFMYQHFRTYDTLPIDPKAIRKNYTDTADTGSDWLCSICYVETETGIYVTDVLYTKKSMEFTEPETARMLTLNDTDICYIESNNGGRGFGRNVETNLRKLENYKTRIVPFTQTLNKNVRIFSHSAEVCNMVYFPTNWERRWPDFARDMKTFRKEGNNLHDDAPDCVTGMVEKLVNKKKPGKPEIMIF